MDASRLLSLLKQVISQSEPYKAEFAKLIATVEQAKANPGQSFYPQIEAHRQKLHDILVGSFADRLVPTRRAMLHALDNGADGLFGSAAVAQIDAIFTRTAAGGPSALGVELLG